MRAMRTSIVLCLIIGFNDALESVNDGGRKASHGGSSGIERDGSGGLGNGFAISEDSGSKLSNQGASGIRPNSSVSNKEEKKHGDNDNISGGAYSGEHSDGLSNDIDSKVSDIGNSGSKVSGVIGGSESPYRSDVICSGSTINSEFGVTGQGDSDISSDDSGSYAGRNRNDNNDGSGSLYGKGNSGKVRGGTKITGSEIQNSDFSVSGKGGSGVRPDGSGNWNAKGNRNENSGGSESSYRGGHSKSFSGPPPLKPPLLVPNRSGGRERENSGFEVSGQAGSSERLDSSASYTGENRNDKSGGSGSSFGRGNSAGFSGGTSFGGSGSQNSGFEGSAQGGSGIRPENSGSYAGGHWSNISGGNGSSFSGSNSGGFSGGTSLGDIGSQNSGFGGNSDSFSGPPALLVPTPFEGSEEENIGFGLSGQGDSSIRPDSNGNYAGGNRNNNGGDSGSSFAGGNNGGISGGTSLVGSGSQNSGFGGNSNSFSGPPPLKPPLLVPTPFEGSEEENIGFRLSGQGGSGIRPYSSGSYTGGNRNDNSGGSGSSFGGGNNGGISGGTSLGGSGSQNSGFGGNRGSFSTPPPLKPPLQVPTTFGGREKNIGFGLSGQGGSSIRPDSSGSYAGGNRNDNSGGSGSSFGGGNNGGISGGTSLGGSGSQNSGFGGNRGSFSTPPPLKPPLQVPTTFEGSEEENIGFGRSGQGGSGIRPYNSGSYTGGNRNDNSGGSGTSFGGGNNGGISGGTSFGGSGSQNSGFGGNSGSFSTPLPLNPPLQAPIPYEGSEEENISLGLSGQGGSGIRPYNSGSYTGGNRNDNSDGSRSSFGGSFERLPPPKPPLLVPTPFEGSRRENSGIGLSNNYEGGYRGDNDNDMMNGGDFSDPYYYRDGQSEGFSPNNSFGDSRNVRPRLPFSWSRETYGTGDGTGFSTSNGKARIIIEFGGGKIQSTNLSGSGGPGAPSAARPASGSFQSGYGSSSSSGSYGSYGGSGQAFSGGSTRDAQYTSYDGPIFNINTYIYNSK